MSKRREKLAEYAHSTWSEWMDYLFSKCTLDEAGDLVIPEWAVKRWKRQVETEYAELSEQEKESDRKEADRMLSIMCAKNNKQ